MIKYVYQVFLNAFLELTILFNQHRIGDVQYCTENNFLFKKFQM